MPAPSRRCGLPAWERLAAEIPPGFDALERVRQAFPIAVVGGRELHARIAARESSSQILTRRSESAIGERAEEDVVGERERGGGRADAEGGDGDGGEREAGRAAQAARGPGEVAAQDVPVRGDGAGDRYRRSPRARARARANGLDACARRSAKSAQQILGVLGAERRRDTDGAGRGRDASGLPRGESAGAGHADELGHAA